MENIYWEPMAKKKKIHRSSSEKYHISSLDVPWLLHLHIEKRKNMIYVKNICSDSLINYLLWGIHIKTIIKGIEFDYAAYTVFNYAGQFPFPSCHLFLAINFDYCNDHSYWNEHDLLLNTIQWYGGLMVRNYNWHQFHITPKQQVNKQTRPARTDDKTLSPNLDQFSPKWKCVLVI